jgi:hypothetical protein
MRKLTAVVSLGLGLVISSLFFSVGVPAQWQDRDLVVWPSRQYPDLSLQDALNAVPDGGVLRIRAGEYVVTEPLIVSGKSIVIQGAGSGMAIREAALCGREEKCVQKELVVRDRGRYTHLIGPEPRPVTDERGSVILPVERAEGFLNFIGGGGAVRDLRISGFDTGVVTVDDGGGYAEGVLILNTLISDVGRGVTALSSADITIQSSAIQNTLWHGVVISAPIPFAPKGVLKDSFIKYPGRAGAYFDGTAGVVSGTSITGAVEGGIVCFECNLFVMNSHIYENHRYGIFLLFAKEVPSILGNLIEKNLPEFLGNSFGDGITMVLSDAKVLENDIVDHPRAGLSNFGGEATLANNALQCAVYELEGEPFYGFSFTFNDWGGNSCGCPSPSGSCVVESAGIVPPEPTAPIK